MHRCNHSEPRPGIVYEISLPLDNTLEDITFNVAVGQPATSLPSSTAPGPGAIAPREALTLSIRRYVRTHAVSESHATIATAPRSEASCAPPHAQDRLPDPSEETPPPTTHTSDDRGRLSRSSSPPVSPTPSQSALPASVVKTLFMRLPEAREFFDSIPLRTPSPASSESVLPASTPPTQPASPSASQLRLSRSPSPPVEDISYDAGCTEIPGNASPPTRSMSRPIDSPSRPVSPAPCPASEAVSPGQSGSDTESEHDHVYDAYTLGCADGRAQGRNDALKLTGEMGSDAARVVAERVLELNRALSDPENPPTYIPIPNSVNGCVLSPRTRKRIAPEVPPPHIIEQRLKRFKEAHAAGTWEELLVE